MVIIEHIADDLYSNLSPRTKGELMIMASVSKARMMVAMKKGQSEEALVYQQEHEIINEVLKG